MSNHHPLIEEFPEHREAVHRLKMNDARFQRLMHEYEEVDKEVVRMEEGIENPEDAVLTEAKKRRLALKDELFAILHGAEGGH